jgi:hypothetical protein
MVNMKPDSIPVPKPSDERLNDIYQKMRADVLNDILTTKEQKLTLVKTEIANLSWYLDVRQKFEDLDYEVYENMKQENPALYEKYNKIYGKEGNQVENNFTLDEVWILFDQLEKLEKYIKENYIPTNA